MELTVNKESVVVEETEISSCAIYDRNYNRNAVMHLADFR